MRRKVSGALLLAVVVALAGYFALSSHHSLIKAKIPKTITKPTLNPPQFASLAEGSWIGVGSKANGAPVTYLASTDSGKIAYLWLNTKLLRFRLIPGTKVPEKSPIRTIDNQRSSWLPKLAAAFNGGFWLRDLHFGGYFYDGTVVRTLVTGQSALAINTSGQLKVGMWGRDFASTANLMVVRENMKLIIDNYQDTSGQLEPRQKNLLVLVNKLENRSLLGQMPDGSLIYEYGRMVNFKTMVQGLLALHVQRAMLLDMNHDLPEAFYYWHVGSRVLGAPIQSQIYNKPAIYFGRPKKDFIVALLNSSLVANTK